MKNVIVLCGLLSTGVVADGYSLKIHKPAPVKKEITTEVLQSSHVVQSADAGSMPSVDEVFVASTRPVVAAVQDLQPAPVLLDDSGKFVSAEGKVSFKMSPGLLRPQVELLLLNHPRIKDRSGIVWNAKENLMWPNHFTVTDSDIDRVLNAILSSYKLHAHIKLNDAILISGGI
jgi:hypothetical protein